MPQPIVHFEILGTDGPKLQKFYSDLFGWKIENMADMGNYGIVDTQGGEGINGAVGQTEAGGPPNMRTIYIAVDDPQATLDKIESLGGKTVAPVTEIPNVVTFAVFADPQGAIVGLVKNDTHGADPETMGPSKGSGAPVGWFEIASSKPAEQRDFYLKIFDWKVRNTTEGEYTYYELDTGTTDGIQGAISSSANGEAAIGIWAKVADPGATLKKAESLGAKIAMEPMQVPDGPLVAGFIDPAGNFFGVYKL